MKTKSYDRAVSMRDAIKGITLSANDLRYQAIQENNVTLIEHLDELCQKLESCSLVSINSIKVLESEQPRKKSFKVFG
jgi:hypothetical protein